MGHVSNLSRDTAHNDQPNKEVTQSKNVNQLKILYTNADGLPNKLDELALLAENCAWPDVIVLTEAIPKAQIRPLALGCFTVGDHYVPYLNFDSSQSGLGASGKRGIVVLVKEDIRASEVSFPGQFEESIWMQIEPVKGEILILGAIYRSPSCDGRTSTDALCELMKTVSQSNPSSIVITGDFNYREINWKLGKSEAPDSHYTHKFLHTMQDCFLIQHVEEPTHFMPNKSPSTLDLIFTSEEGMVADLKHHSPLGNSHHDCLVFTLRCKTELVKGNTQAKDFKNADFPAMDQAIRNSDIMSRLQLCDADSGWEELLALMHEAEKRHIPLRSVHKKKRQPYTNSALLRAKRNKDRLYQLHRRSKSEQDKQEYKRAKNVLRNLTRRLRRNYESQLAKHVTQNPKVFWKYVSSKTKVKARVETLSRGDGTSAITSEEKAEVLNNFFSKVFTEEDTSDIPEVDPKFNGEPLTSITVQEEEIRRRLEALNCSKSPGPDGLHPRVLKELATPLCTVFKMMFQRSIDTGVLPAKWKEGNVVPIFKKGNRGLPGNYRPVSLTSIVCKLLESLVRDRLLDHFLENDLLTNDQFGFLPGRSCALQLLLVIEEWLTILDRKGAVDVVYLDFQKAFDRVPHQRLLRKLEAYGIGGDLLRWVSAFLTNRRQRVMVEGVCSNWTRVGSGIPQGSVLGPLLFLVFINDLPEAVRSRSMLFADDTKLYQEVTSLQDKTLLQQDIDALGHWADRWQLPFNQEKCKLMHLGSSNEHFTYQMKGSTLAQVHTEKDLGLVIDEDLKFHEQVAAAVGRANRVLGLVKRSFKALDSRSLPLLYRTLVRPHLEYANVVWGPTFRSDQDAIERVQRRATKLVRPLRHLQYQDRLRALNLPSMYYRRMRGDMIMAYQILTGCLRVRVADLLQLDTSDRTRGHHLKLKKRRVNSHLRQTSFCHRIVDSWNSLPADVVAAPSLNTFKNRLDKLWANRKYTLRTDQACGARMS